MKRRASVNALNGSAELRLTSYKESLVLQNRRSDVGRTTSEFIKNVPQISSNMKSGEYRQKLLPTEDHLSCTQRQIRGAESHILERSREKFKLLQIM